MNKILPVHTLEFLVTQNCNLNCKYCFEKCKSKKNMDFNSFLSFLDLKKKGTFKNAALYPFGGEPTLNIAFFDEFYNYIENLSTLSKNQKEELYSGLGYIVTNGTLLDKHIDFLKEHNCTLQVSIDGPEEVNDKNRVDYNEKGHFKQIMHNLELCRKNGIHYNLHGAIAKNNWPIYIDIFKFYVEQILIQESPENLRDNRFEGNFAQLISEGNITDHDIDILMEQYEKVVQFILTDKIFEPATEEKRKRLAAGFLRKTGGHCAAGTTMLCYDCDFNIYPCHKLNTGFACEKYSIAQLGNKDKKINWNLYLLFQEISRLGMMCGIFKDVNFYNGKSYLQNWCPSTNLEGTGSIFTVPSKWNVVEKEFERFIPALAAEYDLPLN